MTSHKEPSRWVGFTNLDPTKDTPPESDLYYHVLSGHVPAFLLGERRWGELLPLFLPLTPIKQAK
jgi:hypothetical protein